MIPAYSEEVKITIKEQNNDGSLENQVKQLHEQVRLLKETVEYMNRERTRLKQEVEQIKNALSRS
jgi:regulator of replication initiation timing